MEGERFEIERVQEDREILERYQCVDRSVIDGTVSDEGEDDLNEHRVLLVCEFRGINKQGDHQRQMNDDKSGWQPPSVETKEKDQCVETCRHET